MWKVDCLKLINKIGITSIPEATLLHWQKGHKPRPKTILNLEAKFDIDFRDYVIIVKEPQTISERVKFLREINGFSQGELGAELLTDFAGVRRLETRDNLAEDKVFELTELFGCQPLFLKKGGEPYADKKFFS